MILVIKLSIKLVATGIARDDKPKKKTGLKKRFGVATIVILENYEKP